MSTEYISESETASSRKRAAWVLGTLVVLAGVIGVVMLTLFNDGSSGTGVAGPTTSIATSPSPTTSRTNPPSKSSTATSTRPPSTSTSTTTTPATTPPPTGTTPVTSVGPASCPGNQPCVLPGDAGGAIAAVNAYRTSHGKAAVPGTVSTAAQRCALTNGGSCHGSWAESQVPNGTGAAAVNKILSRGHVLGDYKAFEVGWAYDPVGKQYFFALIRTG